MYDFDHRNPWDWTDYVRVGIGLVIMIVLIYLVLANMPEPILRCQSCCP